MSNISVLGSNGEFLDDTLDNYHLGNGYRAYNPTTMQFTAPDDMSPFGHGGINPYMYCSGDPINNTDPTGHFWGLALAIAVFNMVSPVQAPEELTLAAMERAGINTLANIGAEVVMPGAGGELAIGAEHAAEAALRTTSEHAIEGDVERASRQGAEPAFSTKAGRSKTKGPLNDENSPPQKSKGLKRSHTSNGKAKQPTKAPKTADKSRSRTGTTTSLNTEPWRFSHEYDENELTAFLPQQKEKLKDWKNGISLGAHPITSAKEHLRGGNSYDKLGKNKYHFRFQGGRYPRMDLFLDDSERIIHTDYIGPHKN